MWRFTTFPTPSSIVAWGYNYDGQCNVPEPNTGFIAADGGRSHSLGLKSNGSIIAWGNNLYHQCSVPFPNTGFIAVAAGFYHSLGLKADGSIVAWGWNGNGQCNVPAPNTDFIAVAAGYTHSLGLKADGSIVAWGSNNNGQCNVPEPNTGFIAVDGGSSHSLGLKDDGSIVAWGSNDHGQCNLPTPNTNFTAISTCNYHNLGLKANGSVVAWGSNNYGQCNVPEPNTNFIAVSAGWEHSLGLKSDESIVGWGKNNYGQSYVPPPNTNFVIIATGYNHNLCIRQNSPPYIPSNPYPSSNATNISVNTLLNWIGGDSDPNDIVTYDVYFGTNNPPPKIVSNQTGTSYDPGTINYNITYYWKITAWDNHGASTAGPIWSYTTVTKPPAPAQPVDITAWHIYTADLYKGIGGYPGRYNGQPYTYQSNSTETSSDLYFTFYWDEDNITVVGPVSDSASATHTYGQWGTYNITVTVKHGTDGTPSESSVARSVRMYKAGDVNLDNRVTFADIDPFVETLSGHLAYVTAHPDGYWFTADCNQDGNVTFADIDPFVALLGTK